MEPIIFQKAGRIMVVPYNSDGTLDIANKAIIVSDAVQEVQPSISKKIQDIPDGNSDWPAAKVETGKEGKVTITTGVFPPDLFASVIGQTVAAVTNKPMWAVGVDYTISASNAITLAQTPAAGNVPIVTGIDGTKYTKVASAPTAGQFSITGATLTFNAADANKPVKVTYQYSAATGNNFGLPETGSNPALYVVIDGEATNKDGNNVQDCNIIIDKCMVEGDINFPQFKREPGTFQITLNVIKPRGGQKAIDVSFSPNVAV
jgi:hypothetical protein